MRHSIINTLMDAELERVQGSPRHPNSGPRYHLGASIIGRDCDRELVYSFRQCTKPWFPGKILRLFDRGHEEEFRLVEFLHLIKGVKIEAYDPETIYDLWHCSDSLEYVIALRDEPGQELLCNWICVTDSPRHVAAASQQGIVIPEPKQFKFKGYKGHFSGSLDGIATGFPGLEPYGLSAESRLLAEFKTHGLNSFKKIIADDTFRRSKPEHWDQMQTYIEAKDLDGGMYFAVCKNDDDIWAEFVPRDRNRALAINHKAAQIIDARRLPPRIPGSSASHYRCRFCDHRAACHMGQPVEKSCRSCKFAGAVEGGKWHCDKWGKVIPDDFAAVGCAHWRQIED